MKYFLIGLMIGSLSTALLLGAIINGTKTETQQNTVIRALATI